MARSKYRLASAQSWHHGRAKGMSPVSFISALLIVLLFAGVALWQSHGVQASNPPRVITLSGGKHVWCGLDGLPNCPVPQDWISLPSALPGDVLSAIAGSQAFKMLHSRYQFTTLDLPVLVHTLSPFAPDDYYANDHWVTAVRDARNAEAGLFDFVFDRAHQRIRFAGYGALRSTDPQYGHPFPFVSAQEALGRLQSERKLAVMTGTTPELVFFLVDSNWIGPEAPHHWTSGGNFPSDPVWMVTGSDGKHYIVGQDTHVYTPSMIPVVQSAFVPGML
ncbi:MAG: hypothetical protein OJF49_000930 [Ktedonobacterales bacterium]|jgi:hypothetical protein|nr:MAG: hypothetical protein OJF49_000930 [Ktedonobacterales bacterium]